MKIFIWNFLKINKTIKFDKLLFFQEPYIRGNTELTSQRCLRSEATPVG